MTYPMHSTLVRALSIALCGSLLAACGGGGSSDSPAVNTAASTAAGQSLGTIDTNGGKTGTPAAGMFTPVTPPKQTPPASSIPAPVQEKLITNVRLLSTHPKATQTNVPVTFGQVFAQGDLAKDATLFGRLDKGLTIPLQMDVKATHPDGSVRHAVISAIIPGLAANQALAMELVSGGTAATGATATTEQLLSSGFTASASATLNGVRFEASADQLIKTGKITTWLAGPNVTEWQVSAPLVAANGAQHPHLTARFAIRWYEASKKARVDVTIENNWAYENAPQNFTYDAEILVDGKSVYAKPNMTHFHHARWRKVFWSGGAPELHLEHNKAYLIGSRALPNYDQNVKISEAALSGLKSTWLGERTEPMGVGMANPYMPSTGGRPDIGILPGWAATYLLSMDKRAKDVTLGTADLAGSWSIHYRDRLTDRPISAIDYPYMTIVGRPGDTVNPATRKSEAFPVCATTTACTNPNFHDSAHQPGFAYLPYLVTGDYYYLEELQFWGMLTSFASNPYYRQFDKGLLQSDQVRGQAWSLRTVAQTAYITPDADRLKSHFTHFVNSNLDWYNAQYTENTGANKLGVISGTSAMVYNNGTGVAPWMDDFFTAAVGYTAELGFSKAQPLLKWKSSFPISRMTAPGACWIDATIYSMIIKDASGAFISNMGDVYKANHTAEFNALPCASTQMASSLKLKVGEMTGYSSTTIGYPSNMQPALAYSADADPTAGKNAWATFIARSVKPDYSGGPQFAIVPR